MEGKVLLIDFSFRNGQRRLLGKIIRTGLVAEEFQVAMFDWEDFNLYLWDDKSFESTIDRAIESSRDMDVVYVHFGIQNFPRGRFNEIVERFKKTGIKVVVESESTIGLENADYVFPLSVDKCKLVEELKRLCQEKNRGG